MIPEKKPRCASHCAFQSSSTPARRPRFNTRSKKGLLFQSIFLWVGHLGKGSSASRQKESRATAQTLARCVPSPKLKPHFLRAGGLRPSTPPAFVGGLRLPHPPLAPLAQAPEASKKGRGGRGGPPIKWGAAPALRKWGFNFGLGTHLARATAQTQPAHCPRNQLHPSIVGHHS